MKKIILICALIITVLGVKAQEKTPEIWKYTDISKATGKEIVVVDSVYDGRAFEKHTLLNIGGKYPNQLFSVFIAKKDYANFEDDILKLFLHKKISVQGVLSVYHDKAQVVVTEAKQLNKKLDWKAGVLHLIPR